MASLTVAPLEAVRATKRLLRAAVRNDPGAQLAAERSEQVRRIADLAAMLTRARAAD